MFGEHLGRVHPDAVLCQRVGDHSSRWSRAPTTTASPSSPANVRSTAGTTTRPCRSRSASKAVPKMKRWKVRAPASVTGSVAALAASASHAARGVIARQPSIHLLTRAPPASSARKRAGTATRPFSSTAWWYSPVNTCCPWPQFLRARMPRRVRVAQWRGKEPHGAGRSGRYPLLVHLFSPLCATSRH